MATLTTKQLFGESRRCVFLILERGENLKQSIRDLHKKLVGKSKTAIKCKQTLLQWAVGLAKAYKAIHAKNLVHADGKLDNVVLVGDEIKIVDLGWMVEIACTTG